MIRPRTLMGIAVLASGFGLAACSSGTNSASTTTTKASSGSTTTTIGTTGGADPGSAFCKDVLAASASGSKESNLSNALTTAMNTNDLAKVKTAFGPFITESQSELQTASAAAPNAPAAVKTAFQTVTAFYSQVRAKVSSATKLATLQSDITTLSNAKPIVDAGTTISGYVTAQCGTASTTTTTPSG